MVLAPNAADAIPSIQDDEVIDTALAQFVTRCKSAEPRADDHNLRSLGRWKLHRPAYFR